MIVCSGAFSSPGNGATENPERIQTVSSLLLTKSQRQRIQERNQLATSRHVTHHKNKDPKNQSEGQEGKRTEIQKTRTIRSHRSLDDNDHKEKPKLRDLKQKELIAKREYLRKLQEKERENNLILKISKSMLQHHQQVLHKERKTAITLLSKIETVLISESEPKVFMEIPPLPPKREYQIDSTPKKQPVPSPHASDPVIPQQKSISSPTQHSLSNSVPFSTISPAAFLPPVVSHIKNAIPLSAQPSFAQEEEEQEDNTSQLTEIHQFPEEDTVEDISDHQPELQAPPSAPQQSLMSKIWGMNTDDFNEVSEGEWSS